MRQAYSNQYGYGPQDSQGAAPNSDNLRLANLKRAVESIEQRMSSGANHPVYPRHSNRSFDSQNHITAQNAQTDELAIMQQHIARLSNQIENSQSAMAGSGLAVADIAQRQRSLSQRPVQSAVQAPQHFQTQPHVQQQSAPPPAPSASASERDRPQRSIPPNQATHNAGLDQRNMKLLVRQLAELKKELGSVKQHVSKPVTIQPKVAQSDIDRIAVAISEMKNQSNYDGEAFEKLNAELKDLRASLGRDLQQTAESNRESVTSAVNGAISEAVNGSINEVVSDAVETIMDQKQSEMSTRLDALARGFDNVILQSSNQRIPQIESLTAQLDSMRLSLEDLPQSLAISRIDDRLADLSSRIESLQTISAHDSHPHEGLNDGQIESIEGRLDEISRALVAVSNMGSKPPVVDLSSVERLEARMADLGRTVDTIAELSSISSPPVEFDDLAVRIDGLTQRLASFEKYAESGDLGGANAIFAAPDIGVIEQQLQALSEQVGEASQPTDLSHLEQHLQQLTERFDAVASDNSNAAQLSNLEAQIGQMTRAMSQQSGASVDFGPMEARLGQIEEHVLAHQASTIEAAQHAAQQAVAMLGPQDDTTQFLAALSQDLQALQQATESVSEHAGQSNTVIHDTLLQIVDRLGFIEDNITLLPEAPIGAPEVDEIESGSAAYSLTEMVEQSEQGAIQQAAVESGFIDPLPDADHVRMPVEAPSLDPVRDLESMSNSEASEDNQPLEPGSQAPNLDQLVAEASYQLKAGADAPSQNPTAGSELLQPVDAPAEIQITGDDARPDAVAAARRALQATTAEMNESAPEVTSAPEATERKRLSAGLLSKLDLSVLRKPVVMAAAAVLLVAAVAWKGYQVLYTGTQVPVAQIETNVTPEPEATSVEPGLVENSEITEETLNTSEQAVRTIDNSESMTKSALAQTTEKTVSSPTEAAEVALSQPQPSTEVQAVGLSSTPPVEPINSAIVDPIPVTPSPKFDVPTDIGPQALISAVEQGEAEALYEVGMRYSKGSQVTRNMTESAKWFERSAEAGFAPAQYSIGSLYEKGIGVKRDIARAADWYVKAAAQGNARAMHNLAVINAMGNPPEVQPDIEKAIGWFEKAADFGVKDSQFNLGILYGQGMGVPQSLATSYKWFAIAAKTGDADAATKRDEVANAMEASELASAQDQVQGWAVKPLNVSTNKVEGKKEWQGKASGTAVDATKQARVKQAQSLLNQRGFSVGEPDGLIGPKTSKAIMEFQRSAGLPITGKVDEKLLKALELQT